jgi:hypothetical protein
MKFIFEVNVKEQRIDEAVYDRLRSMMATFEVMVNTTLPEQRVHLKEEI